jgi:formylglycine-generating enzyme required for sulfatase activity/tRNA A-37 threonylcarbamoyl transferase component Bud32
VFLVNVKPTAHPSVEELRAYRLAKTGTAAAEAIAAHLATCHDCELIVGSLTGDGFGDRVKNDSVPGIPALPPSDLPSELVQHPHYEVQRKLGEGGMGVVYLARNKLMDRLEVLKVVNKSLLNQTGAMERFQEEIRSAARLQHPNLVKAFATLRLGGLVGLAMEYVDGVDLAELVRQKGPLPVAIACQYIRQAALGLQHAHEKGLVHRDIKPHKLIRSRKGEIKILGFGLAKVRREEGGADYMAPEQASDARTADIRADIYSLGCTLYYLLTGRPPFTEQTVMKVILAHREKPPMPVEAVRPDTPAELATVVARMLAKDPAARYQTPAEVARRLTPFIKGEVQPAAAAAPPLPPKRDSGDRQRPVWPRAPEAKRPPGRGRQVGLWAAVALAGVVLLLGILLARPFAGAPDGGEAGGKGQPPPSQERRPGEVITVNLGPSVGMQFTWIPPGEFQMGGHMLMHEKPIHRVTFTKGFYMGVFPVTQSQWQAVMGANPSHFRGADRPVENVSWEACQEFRRKMKQLTGKPMRLPTEAEWEYACRAGTTTDYYTGLGEQALAKAGVIVGGGAGNSLGETHPVGQLAPNAWGLYDMHGNVAQWCQDWYGPYAKENKIDPKGINNGDRRVLRGGSWYDYPELCRAALRVWYAPAARLKHCGFRVCFYLEPYPKEPPPITKAGKAGSPRPGEVLTVSPPSGAAMKFAWIPPGQFQMGGHMLENEKPIHRVTLTKGFYMGVFPVTQSQWQAIMGANPSHFRGADRPVEKVSWYDCQKFCQKLQQHTGKAMRLPTEAEWEYACRAGTATAYYNGDSEAALRKVGWYGANSGQRTHPVGELAPNAWGLYDMHGNVDHWCADWYGPYSEEDKIDKKIDNIEKSRVLRGGSFGDAPVYCRAASRRWDAPASRHVARGCRVCFSLD